MENLKKQKEKRKEKVNQNKEYKVLLETPHWTNGLNIWDQQWSNQDVS